VYLKRRGIDRFIAQKLSSCCAHTIIENPIDSTKNMSLCQESGWIPYLEFRYSEEFRVKEALVIYYWLPFCTRGMPSICGDSSQAGRKRQRTPERLARSTPWGVDERKP